MRQLTVGDQHLTQRRSPNLKAFGGLKFETVLERHSDQPTDEYRDADEEEATDYE